MIAKIVPAVVMTMLMVLGASSASAQALNSAGYYTLSITPEQKINYWGYPSLGTFDQGSLTGVTAVAGGLNHALVLKSDGTIATWRGTAESDTSLPAPQNLTGVKAIAAGGYHSLVLLSDGTVNAWGENHDAQSSVPEGLEDVIAIGAGNYYSLALLSNGTVAAWGATNVDGYVPVPDITDPAAVAIAAGGYHSLALLSDGTVKAWGIPIGGQGQIAMPTDLTNVAAIDAGESHSLALRSNGTVAAWGDNTYDQVSGSDNLSDVVYVTAGSSHNHAVHSDGKVTGWGRKEARPLGEKTTLALPTVARWSAGVDGDYLNSHRWEQRIPSTSLSNAVFDQSGTYTVTFGNTALAKNLEISNGKVTFALNCNSYEVADEINITGAGTELHIDGLVTSAQVNNAGLIEIASSGALTNAGNLNNTGTLVNHGTLTNNGTFSNTGNFVNSGNLINHGTINDAWTVTGTLSGNGHINGMLTVANGGSLAPGASVGRMHVAESTFGPGGIFDFEINDAMGIAEFRDGWDVLQLTGSLKFTANPANKFLVNISTLNAADKPGLADNFDPTRDYSWAFVTAGGGIQGFEADYFAIDDDGFQNNTYGGNFWISQDGGDRLMLNFDASLSAVPEPSSLAVLSLCGLGWAGYRIRTKKRGKSEVDGAA